MRSLGLDIGDKRTGVAICDPEGILATPLTVLDSKDEDTLIDVILKMMGEYKAERIVIGLPRSLNGELGNQAHKVMTFIDKLSLQAKRSRFNQFDIQLWDERLSTRAAERLKLEIGGKGRRLRSRLKRGGQNYRFRARAEIDAIAAAFILQGFLNSQRTE